MHLRKTRSGTRALQEIEANASPVGSTGSSETLVGTPEENKVQEEFPSPDKQTAPNTRKVVPIPDDPIDMGSSGLDSDLDRTDEFSYESGRSKSKKGAETPSHLIDSSESQKTISGAHSQNLQYNPKTNSMVALLGINSIFGKISSLLLKQSSLVKRLALYDEFNVDSANDISIINTNCKVEAFLGKEKLNDALKGADLVIIGDGNLSTPHTCLDLMAPKICDYAKAIATSSPNAIVVVAASPVNILLPLLSEVLIECGSYNSNKIIGAMAVDNARANSILAAHLKISPHNVILPVIGGTSKDTRIPLISQAKPSVSLSDDVVKKIISDVRKVDDHIFSLKKTPEALNKAYTTVRFLKSVLTGLTGGENIMQIAFTRTNLIPQVEYFALPVQIGRFGVKKTFGLPPLLPLEEQVLESSIQSIQIDIEQAKQFFKSKECLMDSFNKYKRSKKFCQNEREETIFTEDENSVSLESSKSALLESSKCEDLSINNLYLENKNLEPLQKSYFKTNYCLDCFDNNNNNNNGGNYEVKNYGINNNSLNKSTSHAIDDKEESHNEELSPCSRQLENKLPQKENKLKSYNKPIKNKIDMLLLESNQCVQEDEKMYAGGKIIETPKPLSKQSLIETLVKNMTNKTLEEERNQILINEKRIQSELKKKISQVNENKLNVLLSLNKTLSESKPTPFPQEDRSMMESVSDPKCTRLDVLREAREQQEVYRNLRSNKTPSLQGKVTNTEPDTRNHSAELPKVPQKNPFSGNRGHKQLNNTQNESSILFLVEDSQQTTNNRHSFKKYIEKINNSLELSNFSDKTSLNETTGQKKKPLTTNKPTIFLKKYLLEKIINDEHSLQKQQTNNINKSLDISNFPDRGLFREVTDQNQFNNNLIGKEPMQFLAKDPPKEINNARKYYVANSKKSLEFPNFCEDSFLKGAIERQQLRPKSQSPEFSHNNCQNVFLERILSSVKLQNYDTNNILQHTKPSSNNDNRNINELNRGTENYLTNGKKAKDKFTTNSSIGNDTQLDISKSLKIKQPTNQKEEYSSYFNTKQIVKVSDITKDNIFTVKTKFTPEIKVKMQDNVSNAYQKPQFSSTKQFSPTPNLVLSVNKKSPHSHKEYVNDTSNILIDSDKKVTQNKKLKLKDITQNTKTVPQKTLSYLKRRNEIFKQFFSRPENISVNNKSTNNEAVDCLIENLFTEVEDCCELPVPAEICMDSNSELSESNNNNKNELKPDCNNLSEVSNNCKRKPTVVTFSASSDICNEVNQSSKNENPSVSITTNNKILENKDTNNGTIHGIKLGIEMDEGTDKFDSELSDTFVSKNNDKELEYPFTEDQDFRTAFYLPNREKSGVLCYEESSTASEGTTDSYSVDKKTSEKLISNKEQKNILEKKFDITNSKNNLDDLQCKKSESKIIFIRNLGKSVQNFALKKSLLPAVKETDIKSVKVHTNVIKSNNINENSNHGKSKISPIVNKTEIHNSFSKLWMASIKKKTTNNLAISYIDYIRKSQPLKVSFTHNSIYSRGDELKSTKEINSEQNNTTPTEAYVGNSLDLNPILINSRIKSSYNEKHNQINKVAQYSTSSVRRKSPSRRAVDKIKHKLAKKKPINTNHCVVNKGNPHNTLLKILNKNFKNKTSHKSNSYLKFHLSSKISKNSLEDIHKYFYNRNPSHLSYISTQNLTDEICKKTKTIFTKNDISKKSPRILLNKSLNKKHNFLNEKVLNVKNDTQVKQNSIFNYVMDSTSSYLYRKNFQKEKRFFHTNSEKCPNSYTDHAKLSASKIYENFIETRSMENLYKMYTKNLTQFEYSRGFKMPPVQTLQGGSNSIK